jgi:hypothetical protein
MMQQAEFEQHVGGENICPNIAEALERAKTLCPQVSDPHRVARKWGRRSTDAKEFGGEPTET